MQQRFSSLVSGQASHGRWEKRCLRRDGQTFWVTVSASRVQTEGAAYVVIAVQDISGQKQAEEALRFLTHASISLASSLGLEATLETLEELAVPALADLCATYLPRDDEGHKLVGVRCQNPELQAHARRALSACPELLGEALRRTQTWGAEAGPDAELERLGLSTVMAIPLDAGGRAVGALLLGSANQGRAHGRLQLDLAREFGRRAALAVQSARLLTEAQEASRLKDEFLAVVSHELRTPLSSILGWVRLLQGPLAPADRERGLATMERSVRSLATIIDDLLDVSRIASGKLVVRPRPTELAPAIGAAVDAIRAAAEAKRVSVMVDCPPSLPPVYSDPARLQQVVWNLVSNSVKFTPAGGSLQVQVSRAGNFARIAVSDTGRGIAPEFLPHVFDRFRQADSTTTRAHGGLGLGLSIVRDLVERQGGEVGVESEGVGHGARFLVTLPLVEAPTPLTLAPPRAKGPSLSGACILVVDDDPDTREVVTAMLEVEGAKVQSVASAPEALTAMDREPPDLVVSDIAMPGQDGFSLLRSIRERTPAPPVLALTAIAQVEERRRALAAGFARYLVKPVGPNELSTALKEVLSRRPGDGSLEVS
ncbi:MAG: response regulator [Deltaproteobacteria bacterium]|nr:response regulator [Deltaproteobacteria bacterium]